MYSDFNLQKMPLLMFITGLLKNGIKNATMWIVQHKMTEE